MAKSKPHPSWLFHAGAAFLLAALVLQCALSSRLKSPTVDEFVHLPVGYSLWVDGDFLTDPINPPLMRLWAALPLLVASPVWNFEGDEMRDQFWIGAYRFMKDNADRYQAMFEYGRWMVMALSVVLGIYVYLWASELYGLACGVAALFFYAFCPNIIAHSSLVTADLGGACFIFLTLFHFRKYRRTSSQLHLGLTAVFLGLALLSKFTALFLVPILLLLYLIDCWPEIKRWSRPEIASALSRGAVCILIVLLVLHAGYGFDGLLPFAGDLPCKSRLLSAIQGFLPSFLPIPLPDGFILGIDHALQHDLDLPEGSFYLLGELSSKGWWYYFLVAALVKIPLPTLSLGLAAAIVKCRARDKSWREELFLVVPAVSFFVLISAFTSLNIGFRHVLMVLPFLFVFLCELFQHFSRGRPFAFTLLLGSCVWLFSSTARIYPDYLAYFNELGGGPEGGRRVLIDSNLDWGQDLIQLKRYLQGRGNPKIRLGYFGRVDPQIYGIQYEPLTNQPETGLVVLSVTFLHGRPYLYPSPEPLRAYRLASANYFAWLRDYEPVARIGHTLFVYEIEHLIEEKH